MTGRWRRLVAAWPTPAEDAVLVPVSSLPVFLRPTFGLENEIIDQVDVFDALLRRAMAGTTQAVDAAELSVPVSLFDLLDHALEIGLYDSGELDDWRRAVRTRCNILVPDRVTPGREEIVEGIAILKHLNSVGMERLGRLEIIHGAYGGGAVAAPLARPPAKE